MNTFYIYKKGGLEWFGVIRWTACICTALLSWITSAHLVPLSVTKHRTVHFILNLGHVEYEPGRTNGQKIVSIQVGFKPTISCLKV